MRTVKYVVKTINMLGMIFQRRSDGKIKINTSVVERMQEFIQNRKYKLEAGGVLLGRYLKDSENIIVDRITVPMVGDKQERNYFKRQEKRHQMVIEKAWDKSGGTCNYLGEWHTHAEWYPVPSQLDKKEWKRKLKEDIFDSDTLYFIIVGIKKIRVWEGNKTTMKIKRINLS